MPQPPSSACARPTLLAPLGPPPRVTRYQRHNLKVTTRAQLLYSVRSPPSVAPRPTTVAGSLCVWWEKVRVSSWNYFHIIYRKPLNVFLFLKKTKQTQTEKPVSAAEAKGSPLADSRGMHLKAEHVQALPVHNQSGRGSGSTGDQSLNLLYHQTKLNSQKQHVFYILVKNTE